MGTDRKDRVWSSVVERLERTDLYLLGKRQHKERKDTTLVIVFDTAVTLLEVLFIQRTACGNLVSEVTIHHLHLLEKNKNKKKKPFATIFLHTEIKLVKMQNNMSNFRTTWVISRAIPLLTYSSLCILALLLWPSLREIFSSLRVHSPTHSTAPVASANVPHVWTLQLSFMDVTTGGVVHKHGGGGLEVFATLS